jgi:5-dehydro-2-deoxygluconokinase
LPGTMLAKAASSPRGRSHLPLFDLIVGTEEEFHIAGGSTDTIEALRAVRAITNATLIAKRGPMGAAAFTGAIPDTLDEGEAGPAFQIEVFNVLGAGDGFMSGLLKGWLEDAAWPVALEYANACGALAVSRHGCTPAYPSARELAFFLKRGIVTPALRHDRDLEQIHWSTNRRGDWPDMRVFAFDHRAQLEAMDGADAKRIGRFKELCLQAALLVADGRHGYGILCDDRLGRRALHAAAGSGLWIGRPVEKPGSRPLRLEAELGADWGGSLGEWPRDHVVKALCFCHPDDDETMWGDQLDTLARLAESARRNDLEFLLEVIPSKVGPVDDMTTARIIEKIYRRGIYPDWWKLEPMTSGRAWANVVSVIEAHDPHTRGIVVLGLDAPQPQLTEAFRRAARFDLVKGFAVGRSIFGDAARGWFSGTLTDDEAVADMSTRYRALAQSWDEARNARDDAA